MATWAVKRDDGNETNERLIKRWKRQANGSRIMPLVRGLQRQKQKLTKRLVRQAKIVGDKYRTENKRKAFYA